MSGGGERFAFRFLTKEGLSISASPKNVVQKIIVSGVCGVLSLKVLGPDFAFKLG
jgi:hypothetical protein